MKTTNTKNNKKTKRKAYESLLLLLLTISLFITATYAWFTDSAYSKGNKVFAGNLYVDIIITEEDLKKQLVENGAATAEDINTYMADNKTELDKYKYERKYLVGGEEVTDTYYRISAMPDSFARYLSSVNLYNMEPGQVKKVHVQYLNKGDLAFRAGGALKLEYDNHGDLKSYTGLETLNQQIDSKVGTYKNNYAVNESNSTKEVNLLYREGRDTFGPSENQSEIKIKVGIGVSDGKIYDIKVIVFKEGEYMHEEELDTAISKVIGLDRSEMGGSGDNKTESMLNTAIRIAMDKSGGESETITVPAFDTINPERILQGIDAEGAEYEYYNVSVTNIDQTQYEKRFKKLLAMQGVEIQEGTTSLKPVQKYSFDGDNLKSLDVYPNYYDNGGHLEDVLEVYVGVDENTDREVYTNTDKEGNPYYFGTLKEFTFLMENGPTADPNFDYDSFTANPAQALQEVKEKYQKWLGQPDTYAALTVEEEYMLECDDANANLYKDYQRYLTNAGGYCLPIDTITKDDYIPSKDGVPVKIYDGENDPFYQYYSEIGECDFVIYMPTDADSRYQNASISLQLGVTATQAEFEMDDTGYMIYDAGKLGYGLNKGDLITINIGGASQKLRVLDVKGDDAKVLMALDVNTQPYWKFESLDEAAQTGNYCDKLSDGYLGAKYEGSNLENIIEKVKYSLIDHPDSPLSEENFVKQSYKQTYYKELSDGRDAPIVLLTNNNKEEEKADYTIETLRNDIKLKKIGESDTINSYIRPLALSDLKEYFGKTSISYIEVNSMISSLLEDKKDEPLEAFQGHAVLGNPNLLLLDTIAATNYEDLKALSIMPESGMINCNRITEGLECSTLFVFDINLSSFGDDDIAASSALRKMYDYNEEEIKNYTAILAADHFNSSKAFKESLSDLDSKSTLMNIDYSYYLKSGNEEYNLDSFIVSKDAWDDAILTNIKNVINENPNADGYIVEMFIANNDEKQDGKAGLISQITQAAGRKPVYFIGNDISYLTAEQRSEGQDCTPNYYFENNAYFVGTSFNEFANNTFWKLTDDGIRNNIFNLKTEVENEYYLNCQFLTSDNGMGVQYYIMQAIKEHELFESNDYCIDYEGDQKKFNLKEVNDGLCWIDDFKNAITQSTIKEQDLKNIDVLVLMNPNSYSEVVELFNSNADDYIPKIIVVDSFDNVDKIDGAYSQIIRDYEGIIQQIYLLMNGISKGANNNYIDYYNYDILANRSGIK